MRTVMVGALFGVVCLLVACQPKVQDATQLHERDDSAIKYQDHKLQQDIAAAPVRYTDDAIILSKIHISAIKPERYQPSFTIQGIITTHDNTEHQLIGRLPAYLKQHINIGSTVNLAMDGQSFSGQVKHLIDDPNHPDSIDVHIKIAPNDDTKIQPSSGQLAKGVIEYGQIEVGALLPDFAIIDEHAEPLDLSKLHEPPYKPKVPLMAYTWVVKQDATLHFSKIQVIEYQPNTRRFLVSGITEDSLVVLTRLPTQMAGKQVELD
ncbi:MAG: hypothetical protein Q4B81_04015 [Moraxella sp.]|nr:hypothetical protein [Moraxella sp.]